MSAADWSLVDGIDPAHDLRSSPPPSPSKGTSKSRASRSSGALRRIFVRLYPCGVDGSAPSTHAVGACAAPQRTPSRDDAETLLDVEELAREYCRAVRSNKRQRRTIRELHRTTNNLLGLQKCREEDSFAYHGAVEILNLRIEKLTERLKALDVSIDSTDAILQTEPVVILSGQGQAGDGSAREGQSNPDLFNHLQAASVSIKKLTDEKHVWETQCQQLVKEVKTLRDDQVVLQDTAKCYADSAEKTERHFQKVLDASNDEIKTLRANIDMINKSLSGAHQLNHRLTQTLKDEKIATEQVEISRRQQIRNLVEEKEGRHQMEKQCDALNFKLDEARQHAVMTIAQLDDVATEQVQLQNQVELLKKALRDKDDGEQAKARAQGTFYNFIQLRRNVFILEYENKVLHARLHALRERTLHPELLSSSSEGGTGSSSQKLAPEDHASMQGTIPLPSSLPDHPGTDETSADCHESTGVAGFARQGRAPVQLQSQENSQRDDNRLGNAECNSASPFNNSAKSRSGERLPSNTMSHVHTEPKVQSQILRSTQRSLTCRDKPRRAASGKNERISTDAMLATITEGGSLQPMSAPLPRSRSDRASHKSRSIITRQDATWHRL